MISTVSNAKLYARLRDDQFSLFEDYARKHGLNSKSMLVLMWIYYNQEGLTQESIAKRTFSTKQVIQAIVKNYMAKGMLYLEPSLDDRRKKLVKLTEQGQLFASDLLEPLAKCEAQAMENLSIQEQEILLRATEKFSKSLKLGLENLEEGMHA